MVLTLVCLLFLLTQRIRDKLSFNPNGYNCHGRVDALADVANNASPVQQIQVMI